MMLQQLKVVHKQVGDLLFQEGLCGKEKWSAWTV